MAGNSQRRGARRTPGSKKGAVVGSGGVRRRGLEGKGPTPPAEARTGHPAARKAKAATARKGGTARPGGSGGSGGQASGGSRRSRDRNGESPELVAGRNPVLEALRAGVPATAVYVALGIDADDRVREAVKRAADRGVPMLEIGRGELDRMTGGTPHQGLALQVPPYEYQHADDLLARAVHSTANPLIVALDSVTDPRNLGAIVRSAAAFGAHGVLVPERRSAAMTAAAWRASAGTAARLPVARVTNLVRTLKAYQQAGLFVAGLDADGEISLDDFEAAIDPLVLVVGSEGRGLSRLVGETCDLTISIPMPGPAESLNASVAAAVTLAETARRRRA